MVSVIIPNHNGKKYLQRCLDSVLKSDYPNYEVIIVDDGSSDESVQFVKTTFGAYDHLTVVCNERNLGAAATRNLGTTLAEAPIIVYLDNDAYVHPRWLKGLVETLETDPQIGIAQSKLLMEDKTRIACAGELIIPYIGWIVIKGFGEKSETFSRVEDICASSGAMAVKREVIDYMGLFDTNMPFVNFEDLDFSFRAWLSGYKVVLAPCSEVYHDARAKGTNPIRRMRVEYSGHRNSLRLQLKNLEVSTLLPRLPLSILAMSFRALVGLRHGDAYPFLGLVRGFSWNVAHISDTLQQRNRVQTKLRRVRDKEIFQHISVRLSPVHIYRLYLSKGRGFW
jgi:GT2 family glycosyltransferase